MADVLELILRLTGTEEVSGKLENLSGKLGDIGQGLTSAGRKMTLGVTAPMVAMGTLAVMAASDYEEAANKVSVVFGEAADDVEAFAEDASTALGMSSAQALEAAGTYGNLFTAMGIGEEKAAGMSTEMIQLAADLASFNNIDPTVALEKLRAGLTGETEPLKALGVNLSAAGIELKALELGLISEGETLDAASKAQASYALILEQTKTAQGDYARTSDGLANTMRTVKAQFGDVAAELGTVLLPFVSQLAGFLKTLLERFQSLTPGQQKWIVILGAVAAAIGPLLVVIGTLVSALGTILPIVGAVAAVLTGPLGLAIAAVIAVIALLTVAWKKDWGGIRTTLTDFWNNTAKPILEQLWKWLGENVPKAIDFVVSRIKLFVWAWKEVINAIKNVIAWVKYLWDKLMSIELPAWLTPGSPTPLELGLKGISSAMRDVAKMSLPEFTASIGAGGAGGSVVNMSLQYAPAVSLADREELETRLGPLLSGMMRR